MTDTGAITLAIEALEWIEENGRDPGSNSVAGGALEALIAFKDDTPVIQGLDKISLIRAVEHLQEGIK